MVPAKFKLRPVAGTREQLARVHAPEYLDALEGAAPERGLVQGVNFSGARLGAAFALPAVAGLIDWIGWRDTFVVLMVVGFVWAGWWWRWFRDDPEEHRAIQPAELEHILATRQANRQASAGPAFPWTRLLTSPNMWLISIQYFASNFTFFFCLTWLHPYLQKTYALSAVEAGMYASAPFLAGADA